MLSLLSSLSPKPDGTLPTLLISDTITIILTYTPTSLHIALGVKNREKNHTEILHGFGVTCLYEEVLQFKASADVATSADVNSIVRAIKKLTDVIRAVADYFDTYIFRECV